MLEINLFTSKKHLYTDASIAYGKVLHLCLDRSHSASTKEHAAIEGVFTEENWLFHEKMSAFNQEDFFSPTPA